jgi:hypothetical protein
MQEPCITSPLEEIEERIFSRMMRTDTIFCQQSGGYSMKELGDYFGLHYSRISRIISQYMVAAKDKT